MTVKKCLKPAISNFVRDDQNRERIIMYIAKEMAVSMSMISAKHKIDPSVYVRVANILIERYPDLSIEDFAYFFHSLALGEIEGEKYDNHMHSVDLEYILRCIGKYYQHKQDAREDAGSQEKEDQEQHIQELSESLAELGFGTIAEKMQREQVQSWKPIKVRNTTQRAHAFKDLPNCTQDQLQEFRIQYWNVGDIEMVEYIDGLLSTPPQK